MKVNSCIFISGNGSNLQSILKNSRNYNFPIKIELVISINFKSKGLKIAKKHGIPFKFIEYKNRINFEQVALYEMRKRKIRRRALCEKLHCQGLELQIWRWMADLKNQE